MYCFHPRDLSGQQIYASIVACFKTMRAAHAFED